MNDNLTVFDLFAATAAALPHKPAVIFKERSISYGELLKQVYSLGSSMLAHGIEKGTHVAVIMRNIPEYIMLVYASHLTGAIIVPVNFRNNPIELQRQLEYSKAEYVFYESSMESITQLSKAALQRKINWCVIGDRADETETFSEFCSKKTEAAFPKIEPDDWALMLFTGGTTGRSKLAVHSFSSLYNWVALKTDTPRKATAEDVFLMSVPMCHSAGLGMLHDMLSNGSTIVLTDRFNAQYILNEIVCRKITQMFLIPPTLYNRIVEQQKRDKLDLSSVRMVSLAGGTVGPDAIEGCFDLFPNARLCVVYSQSERAVFTMNVIDRNTFKLSPEQSASVGKPYLGCEIELRDERGRSVPVGEPGLAWAHSRVQMDCYLNNEEQYVNGWLNTGDLLSRDSDGNYYFLSRLKDCIKTGGENVYASELERVIATLAGVEECAVFGMDDSVYREIVCAAVIRSGNVSGGDIVAYCRQYLASYKKPRKVYFVDSLPRTAVGKVDKKTLLKTLSGRQPDYEI